MPQPDAHLSCQPPRGLAVRRVDDPRDRRSVRAELTPLGEQRQRAQADSRAKKAGHADLTVYTRLHDSGDTVFTGYEELTTESGVRGIVRDAAKQEYRFTSILHGIVTSAPFQMKKAPQGTAPLDTLFPAPEKPAGAPTGIGRRGGGIDPDAYSYIFAPTFTNTRQSLTTFSGAITGDLGGNGFNHLDVEVGGTKRDRLPLGLDQALLGPRDHPDAARRTGGGRGVSADGRLGGGGDPLDQLRRRYLDKRR